MRRLTTTEYRRMPWRNGGGTTTEMVIEPEGAGLGAGLAAGAVAGAPAAPEPFLYRVSIADVASDGPFSRFDGYDRHIMLLAGAGMTLDCGVNGRITLDVPFEPRAFSGDWDVSGALVAGPVRDFNVMVDRTRASASLEVRLLEAPSSMAVAEREVCMLHVIEGQLAGAMEGDTLVLRHPDESFEVTPLGAARVAVVRIVRRG